MKEGKGLEGFATGKKGTTSDKNAFVTPRGMRGWSIGEMPLTCYRTSNQGPSRTKNYKREDKGFPNTGGTSTKEGAGKHTGAKDQYSEAE